jgi:predicted HTH transcriptional regulator
LEDLHRAHPSIPRNPLIAEPLFLTKYIEKAGSGILDMIEVCMEAGLPTPEFRLDAGCFIITLSRKQPAGWIKVGSEQVGTKLGPSRDQVLVLQQVIEGKAITTLMHSVRRTNRTKLGTKFSTP